MHEITKRLKNQITKVTIPLDMSLFLAKKKHVMSGFFFQTNVFQPFISPFSIYMDFFFFA